jgi:hypothetical protein
LARYGNLSNYQRLFAREGVQGPAEIAVVGDESTVERELRRFAEAGVTELWPVVFAVEEEPNAVPRTRALLGQLAQRSGGRLR